MELINPKHEVRNSKKIRNTNINYFNYTIAIVYRERGLSNIAQFQIALFI